MSGRLLRVETDCFASHQRCRSNSSGTRFCSVSGTIPFCAAAAKTMASQQPVKEGHEAACWRVRRINMRWRFAPPSHACGVQCVPNPLPCRKTAISCASSSRGALIIRASWKTKSRVLLPVGSGRKVVLDAVVCRDALPANPRTSGKCHK